MPNPVETAVRTYIRAAGERDPAARAALLEACFSDDVRMVAPSREVRGRAGVAAEIEKLFADPEMVGVRLLSAVDARAKTFRFRSAVERRDGTLLEFFDAGEVDASGRISLILVFSGPLADATEAPGSGP